MKRPEFTKEQEYWLCAVIDRWYYAWKARMTDKQEPHYLGVAKEQLKNFVCAMEDSQDLLYKFLHDKENEDAE